MTPRNPVTSRRHLMTLLATVAIGTVAVGCTATAATTHADTRAETQTHAVQQHVDDLVAAGFPAALASVTTPTGDRIDVAAGLADLDTGEQTPVDGQVRIGSNTKMFTAAIVLQLVDDGELDLDDPIDTLLPGIVHGDGIDATRITVRQLLQHTSGLPDYSEEAVARAEQNRHSYLSPRALLDIAFAQPAVFAPGDEYRYTNTNYIVLGLLVEKLTERPMFEVVQQRLIEPLGLQHTSFPGVGDQRIPGDHPRGYHLDADGELTDYTEMDPSWGWAAGAMVGSPSDLNTFMRALLDGELFSPSLLDEMKTTVPAGDELWPDAQYGLGLQRYELSCGGEAWGHGGDIFGGETRNAVGPDGTAVTIAVTALPWAVVDDPSDDEVVLEQYRLVADAMDQALCDR